MKKLITRHLFKVLLIIAFICLAFFQWKNEKVYTDESDDPTYEQISSITDNPVNDELIVEENQN